MVAGFAWLLLFQLAGEVLVRSLQLPVPGRWWACCCCCWC